MLSEYLTLNKLGLVFFDDIFLTAFISLVVFFVIFLELRRYLNNVGKKMPYWVGLVGIGILVIFRLLHIGHVNEFDVAAVEIDLIVGAIVVMFLLIFYGHAQKSSQKEQQKRTMRWADVIAVLGLLGICTISLWGLDNHGLAVDEYYQFESATAYNATGEFTRWDFVHDGPMISYMDQEPVPYPRAKGYTWVIAQSMRLFGPTIFAARLPAAICFTIFILGIYTTLRIWRKDPLFAFLTAAIFGFSQLFFLQGRIIRFYAPFLVTASASMLSWLKTIQLSVERTQYKQAILWLLAALALTLASYHLQPIFVTFSIGLGGFVLIELLVQIRKNGLDWKRVGPLILGIIGGLLAFGAVLLVDAQVGIKQLNLFQILNNPKWEYEFFPFLGFPLFGLTIVLYFTSIILAFKKGMVYRFLAVTPIPLFIFYLFLIKHFTAPRYFILGTILIIISVSATLYDLLRTVIHRLPAPYRKWILGIGFALLLMPIAFPEVPSVSIFQYSWVHRCREVTVEEVVYNYIKKNMEPGDVVLGFPFRSYYWGYDPEVRTVCLKEQFPIVKKEKKLEEVLQEFGKGWITVKRNSRRDIRPSRKYLNEHAQIINPEEIESHRYEIYYFDFTKNAEVE